MRKGPFTVQFELRKAGVSQDKGTMQFSDVHAMNKYIRETCFHEFWFTAKASFMWNDVPITLCMDLEDDKFALKGIDWELGHSYVNDLSYHMVGV